MQKADDLVFAPLGGVGEIGMNLSVYGYGSGRKKSWIAVDFGVSFGGGEDLPGVDLVMPDIRFLLEERKNLLGLILTHGHEDHFGAIIDLWPRLKVPIYATPFTAALFEAKREAEPGASEIPVNVVPVGGTLKLGPFVIELCSMSHSIPESNALIIGTPLGKVLHTGDWKLDPTPVVGPATDEARLRRLGHEGCLALVGDSTNAVRDGRSPSETEVGETLARLIAQAPQRVAITTFASHVARIRSIALAAKACEREVVLVGRAMERVVQVARETGHLDGVPEFRSASTYGYLPRDKVVALCTGSQGEPRAALARIAADAHPDIGLAKGDRVIFSSRTIPGNEKAVNRIINGLVAQGVEVITERDHLVHVSGHPRRDELKELFGWVKPSVMIPVHGEPLHLAEHARLARSLGVPEVVGCRNGDLVRIAPGPAGIVDEVPQGRLYKDGHLIVEAEARTVPDRRRLAFVGVVSVAVALDETGVIASDPEVALIGIPETDGRGRSFAEQVLATVAETVEHLPRARRRDPDTVAEAVRRAVRGGIAASWGKKPLCLVHVLTV
ncbi:ribonuclease J [Rhodoplanes sp. TEM]|uniref:Ribonuclease J n=1 Tax=Rhodoplanes tepidamans TaxID=200616 RepID=A0ABT5JBR7_RHOTP|nr:MULTISPECIES: ribonuclease J [Rhodoplanes]MDC7786500.1 ribonuclease J [Rhodoplanes tepidamans]MDC7985499.1 ribonuclease J [Rhodoplanes sp. TEM]